jgi:ABC-type spermidine/putrescine transport system permease subunit I
MSAGPPGAIFENYLAFFERPVYGTALFRTLYLSGLVTVCTVIAGFPTAYFLAQLTAQRAQLLMFFVLLPFWTSVLVRSYAWIVLLQPTGIINSVLQRTGAINEPLSLVYNFGSVVLGMSHVLLPFMVLVLYAVLVKIDWRLQAAAASMGANAFQRFIRVTLPLSAPGLAAGSIIVFVLSLGYFIIPVMLGGYKVLVLATMIELQVQQLSNWSLAAACSVILLLVTVALMWIAQRFLGLSKIFSPGAS